MPRAREMVPLRGSVNSYLGQSTQICTVNSRLRSGQLTVDSDLDSQQSIQIWTANSQLRSGQ
ncbi:hypothetical protein F511_32083 [Dorcoceras hygrometricum]|uniref:Uncharacterized protein n=1 Tax=Dorcoceras hygrometricum TaxID=472368 RepID=A0A2Z7AA00_9LAMI|nr:hypothetical protein F511_32083 [Dorcoceras hygrometricum]